MAAGQEIMKEDKKNKVFKSRVQRIRDRYRAGTIDVMSMIDAISHNLKV